MLDLRCDTCLLCEEKAITTAAGVPVCSAHLDEYNAEARQHTEDRPVLDRLIAAWDAWYHSVRDLPPCTWHDCGEKAVYDMQIGGVILAHLCQRHVDKLKECVVSIKTSPAANTSGKWVGELELIQIKPNTKGVSDGQ